jgi:hypothetical protein
VIKTQDKSSKVRSEVYKSLRERCHIEFSEFLIENRISIIVNGLCDIDAEVKE